MQIAIAHDFLAQMGGAEKVVEVLHSMYPEAPIYTSVFIPEVMPSYYREWDIRTSFLQKLPFLHKTHRMALPLYPMAFESFDLSGYDLVISSSSAFAKGVMTHQDTVHICYTHTPMRYGWNAHAYLEREQISAPMSRILSPALHYLRVWDAVASMRVDGYIANSQIVADRIKKFYRRDSKIIYPPVDTSRFQIAPYDEIGDYYLIAARFVPYKRLDLAIEACTLLKRPLKVIGSGRQEAYLKSIAGPTVEFLGRALDEELIGLMSRARAYLMPGQEDFGISPVESNACGRPVIAYGAGGALDSQLDGVTGILFYEQTADSLADAICRSESIQFDPQKIRSNAMRFDTEVFKSRMRNVVDDLMYPKRSFGSKE